MSPTPCPRPARPKLAIALTVALAGCAGAAPIKGGPFAGDPAAATYEVGGKAVTLEKGTFREKTGSGADDFTDTDLTGARLDADFDADDATDCAVVVTRDDGPLKVHYLAVLRGGTTKAITLSLGKNVLVQKLELDPQTNGIIVDMLDHDEGVPVDTPPTIQHKKRFVVKNGAIVPR